MPSFCRHNRLLQNCTICAREQNFEARPVVSSSAPKISQPREQTTPVERVPRERRQREGGSADRAGSTRAVRVRRLARGADDGYHSALIPGLRSSEDAARLAQEVAFAAWRLALMEGVAAGLPVPEAPALWRELAAAGDLDARTELAVGHVLRGPRGLPQPGDPEAVLEAVRAWGMRQGSLQQAFTGEPGWTAERRFERIFERLGGVRGLGRDSRFELLTLLGRLGVYELRPPRLFLAGENEPTWAAKRALGIGDPLLLERRAVDLADACHVPLEALDLAFHSWGSGSRPIEDLPEDAEPEAGLSDRARAALGV